MVPGPIPGRGVSLMALVPRRDYDPHMQIKQISKLPEDFSFLINESVDQGFNFIRKMNDEWASGKNRFDKNGECVFAAFDGDRLIGICGLNVDPYLTSERLGRVRHLYVLKGFRKHGVGTLLMEEIVKQARLHYPIIRLRTDTATAAQFYESLGFLKVADESATHVMVF